MLQNSADDVGNELYFLRKRKFISYKNDSESGPGSSDSLKKIDRQTSSVSNSSYYYTSSQEATDIAQIWKLLNLPDCDLQDFQQKKSKHIAYEILVKMIRELIKKLEHFCNTSLVHNLSENFLEDAFNFTEILKNFQSYFQNSNCSTKKMEILAILPKSWKFEMFAQNFKRSYWLYMKLLDFDRDICKFESMYSL